MRNWIARWFGAAPRAQQATDAVHAPLALAPTPSVESTVPLPNNDAVDLMFYRWLTGAEHSTVSAQADKRIVDELARLAASPGGGADLVPRVPAVIPQLLKSLRDDGVSGVDLARQIGQDVVLVAEVIREANSPYYHPTAPVRTVEGAIMLLGQNGLRMLLARVAFRPIISMQTGQFAPQVAPLLWRQSEKCALAASVLAPGVQANPFEAYLAGLMHNVGMIVACRLIDQIQLERHLPQTEQFCSALTRSARVLSGRIAALWDFPVSVVDAIERMGSAQDDDVPPLASALTLADQISKLRLLMDAGLLEHDEDTLARAMAPAHRRCFELLRQEN